MHDARSETTADVHGTDEPFSGWGAGLEDFAWAYFGL
jgi:hypothetical protein